MADCIKDFESLVLENGITLYANHVPNKTFEVFGFLIHSGAEKDKIGLEGTAHFVEHVISRNSSTSKKEMELFFDNSGGGAKFGTTGYFFTRYEFFLPINNKDLIIKGLSMFADMLFFADIQEMENQRKIIIEEFNRKYKESFDFNLALMVNKILYPNIWAGKFTTSLGNLGSIARIQKKDLQDFYKKHYTTKNISIFCAGGMTIEEAAETIRKTAFLKTKNGKRMLVNNPKIVFSELSENRFIFNFSDYLEKGVVKAARYYMSVKIPNSFNPMALKILTAIFNRVLFDEVREKYGWTYSINANCLNYIYFTTFSINCDNLNPIAVDKIEGVVDDCIKIIGNDLELFNRLKRKSISITFINDDKVLDACTKAMDSIIFHGSIISVEEDRRLKETVTMDDIVKLLYYFKPEYRHTLIMKP